MERTILPAPRPAPRPTPAATTPGHLTPSLGPCNSPDTPPPTHPTPPPLRRLLPSGATQGSCPRPEGQPCGCWSCSQRQTTGGGGVGWLPVGARTWKSEEAYSRVPSPPRQMMKSIWLEMSS